MLKKTRFGLLIGLLISFQTLAADYVEGTAFAKLSVPQPVQTGKKIEVVELFWYGCPHCFALEPFLEKWLKEIPKNAEYVRLPAILRDSWAFHARAYFTFEALDAVDKLHGPFFDSIHKDKKRYSSIDALVKFVAKHGIKKKQFMDAFNSFAVDTKTKHATLMSKRYNADGVPTIIVDGKYRTTSTMAGSHEELMKVINFLIAKAAKERQ